MSEGRPLILGLAGFGTVGGGLCELLRENADLIARRTGTEMRVKSILVRDASRARSIAPPPGASLTTNVADLLDDDEISVVVELMGGIEKPFELIAGALARGRHVVTANKALLAEKGAELFALARKNGCIMRYEASVAGAIPIVAALKENLAGNRILSLTGILNGTSNYVLSEMTTGGLDFQPALDRATELGYAEADPTLDIDGLDAAHKLALLVRLAYGLDYPWQAMSVRGIRGMSALDISMTSEFGYRIKLIAQVRQRHVQGRWLLEAGVFPALVPDDCLLASVGGVYNAISIEANAAGSLFFHGRGAGALPTASAVLSDLMAVARNERPDNTGFFDCLPPAPILAPEDWRARYYVRVMVRDAPGVLRDISGCMAAEGISVASMIQKGENAEGSVPLVFMTHQSTARAMKAALESVKKARLLREPAVYYRVLDCLKC